MQQAVTIEETLFKYSSIIAVNHFFNPACKLCPFNVLILGWIHSAVEVEVSKPLNMEAEQSAHDADTQQGQVLELPLWTDGGTYTKSLIIHIQLH